MKINDNKMNNSFQISRNKNSNEKKKNNVIINKSPILQKRQLFKQKSLMKDSGISKELTVPSQLDILKEFNNYEEKNNDFITSTNNRTLFIIKFPLLVINPYGMFKKIWNIIMCFFLIYTVLVLPVKLSILSDKNSEDWFTFEIFTDISFIIDIFVNFFSAFENEESGVLVYKLQDIIIYYLKGWFFIDLISSFPLDYILEYFILNKENTSNKYIKYTRISKFLDFINSLKFFVY